jgi:hypothetical protein
MEFEDSVAPQGISLAAALNSDLMGLPPEIAESPLAILALQLAEMVDRGERVPECSREFRQCLSELRALSAGVWRDSALDQLQARREQRRKP